ncbi:FAD-dependent monooxygenase [Caballeronia sp. HLA56]
MRAHHSNIFDVVIVGAGPVGLFLACELRLFDLSVLVIEQAEDSHSALKRLPFGIRGLSASTLDALYRRDLLEEVVAAQRERAAEGMAASTPHWAGQVRQPAGHFAGIQFYHDDIDTSKWPYRLPSPAGTSMAVELELLESVLARRAHAMGAEIRRGFRVDAINALKDEVSVHAGSETFHGRWLVGCDGGRSAVRKAGSFQFVGTDPEFTGYSVEVEMADPEALRAGRHYTPVGMYTYARPGTIAMVEFDGGAFHRVHPITLEHVEAVLRRVSGADVTLTELRIATTWTDRSFQATTYREGRVLLAGDAAHIHSPLGGQGLNLGIGDAMNLGWKLAATIRGDAPADVLDSYQRERHPVGAAVLDWSRAQVALMRPTPSTRALGAIMRDLIETRDGATYFAERVWGVSLRYELGREHPLLGHSVPDFELVDGTKVGCLLREGKGIFLDFDGHQSRRLLTSGWRGRVTYVAGDVRNRLGLRAVLARPDGIVAWATETTSGDEEIAQALSRWFGEPECADGRV